MKAKWIACSMKFPPANVQVLAYGPSKGNKINGARIDICLWDGDAWWDDGGTELSQEKESTTTIWGDPGWSHWMPLPDAPKKPKKNGK